MSGSCCSAQNHPVDYYCREILLREKCDVRPNGDIFTRAGSASGGGNQRKLPESLVDLEQSLGDNPSPTQLLALLREFHAAGFDTDVDRLADFLEIKLPNTDYGLLSNVYRVRSESLMARGEPYRALDALDIAHDLERIVVRREVMLGRLGIR